MRISGNWGSIGKARYLRSTLTPPERLLWKKLRANRLCGLKFRRQVPIGSYVMDFACLEKKVIVEVDGSGHALRVQSDEVRDQWMKENGFKVLRFSNILVEKNLQHVLRQIASACGVEQQHDGTLSL